jgi:hypothetical protein
MSYTLIERRELTSVSESIEFTSIPGFYTDLIILGSARNTGTEAQTILFGFNGSAANFSSRFLQGNGSSASTGTLARFAANAVGGNETAATFSNFQIYIPDYAGSTNKAYSTETVTENNATQSFQTFIAGLWDNTAAISSISLTSGANNFAIGTSFSLYGINRHQAIGKPKAIGGAISFANGYWVHSFTGSGTFIAQEDIECQYLVIAGGGGTAAGGAGAGGYRTSVTGSFSGGGVGAEQPIKLFANSSHLVSVGAGGPPDSIGAPSSFGAITSLGGGYGRNSVFGGAVSGGSGGGFGGGAFGAGASGTAGQGFAGGSGGSPFPNDNGGGGGGAGSVGGNGGGGNGGGGGVGLASTITGTSVFRAGGGGGQSRNNLITSGGVGGGGNGGNAGGGPIGGTSGVINTGGGAGGGYDSVASGGSGIVIIRYKAD